MIFGPPGHAYATLFGMHECLNLVCEPEGKPGCVLVPRALEPLAGMEQMQARRGGKSLRNLMSGPGKLTQAMGISRAENGADVTQGDFVVCAGKAEPFRIEVTPRVGIRECADWPLRFLIQGNAFVSKGRVARSGDA